MAGKRILICSHHTPQPDFDSYSRRLFHFVEFLREVDWIVTSVAGEKTTLEESVQRLIMSGTYDVAILGFWHVADRVLPILRRCSPATAVIVDSGDMHFLRDARRIFRESDALDSNYASDMTREINAYAAADAVFSVSQKEADCVADFTGNPR